MTGRSMTGRHRCSGPGQGGGPRALLRLMQPPDQNDRKVNAMSDVNTSKSKSKSSAEIEFPKFEIPRFEMPKFEMPKFEVPMAFREFAEKSVSQCKDNWEKMKVATEEATGVIEDSYATAAKGCTDYGIKVIEAARANTN